jgi:hypothetical protein
MLKFAEGKSQLSNTEREGLVIRSYDITISFKVILNKFLLKKNNVKHKIKRFLQKQGLKFYKLFNSNLVINEQSRFAVLICHKLINKEDSILLMSPISQKRYIKNDSDGLFIIINDNQLTIVNNMCSYSIITQERTIRNILNRFDNEIEKRRQIMETETRSNVKHSLVEIYKNI